MSKLTDELYQVVGVLADEAGVLDDPQVTYILDVLSGLKKHKKSFLPFEPKKKKNVTK